MRDQPVPVVCARRGHRLTRAWQWRGGGGEWPGLDLHRGLLRQHPDPAARWQGFATSLGLSFLTSEMG